MFKIKSAKLGIVAVFLALTAFTQGWPQFVSADANEGAVGGPNTLEQAAITAGGGQTCALLTTGAVKCWGINTFGQVGDNTTDTRLTPTQVDGLTSGVTAITTGGSHACALLTTGAVKCWGDNTYGQVGDNTTDTRLTPTQVDGLTSGVTAISAGLYHVCALLSTGAVECWGWNYYGQVGDNTDVDKLTPTQVLTGVGPTTTTTTTTTEPETTTTTTASTTTTAASTTIAVATTVVSASKLPETGSPSDRWIIAAIIAMISGTVLVTRRRNLS